MAQSTVIAVRFAIQIWLVVFVACANIITTDALWDFFVAHPRP